MNSTQSSSVRHTIEKGNDPQYPLDVYEECNGKRVLVNSYTDIEAVYDDFEKDQIEHRL